MTFTILTVCTGNICRSPYAEADLRRHLEPFDVHVKSAGTGALIGEAVPEPGQRLAMEAGIDLSGHRGRQIVEADVREADLILTSSREHRSAVVAMSPAALRRTFTLREFARIADHFVDGDDAGVDDHDADVDRLTSLVAFAARVRGTIAPPSEPADLDIIDPFLKHAIVYRESYDSIARAVESTARFLLRESAHPGRS